jgi:GxxExxY protein
MQGSPAPPKKEKNMNDFDVTHLILECAFEVVNELGIGFLESVYKNALVVALENKGLNVDVEKTYEVMFYDRVVGLYIADLVVNNEIIVEVKCCKTLLPEHQAQVINYLAASNCLIGLLINFGSRKLEIRRLSSPNTAEVPF